MTKTTEKIYQLTRRAHIGKSLAGLDMLGMADNGLSPAELAETIPDANVAETHAIALEMVTRVFNKPDDERNRRYWNDVAACLAKRM